MSSILRLKAHDFVSTTLLAEIMGTPALGIFRLDNYLYSSSFFKLFCFFSEIH
jgi:hypothetical protein